MQSKFATSLALLFLFSAHIIAESAIGSRDNTESRLAQLLNDLHAEPPWLSRQIEDPSLWQYAPDSWGGKAIMDDMQTSFRRDGAKLTLSRMGTNAWPAVPFLLKDVLEPEWRAIDAVEILAAIDADESPAWPILSRQLAGKIQASDLFRQLLRRTPPYEKEYYAEQCHFALLGLAAVGPAASLATNEILGILVSKDHHDVWVAAIKTLKAISGDPLQLLQFHKNLVQDSDEWPRVRASSLRVLAATVPDAEDTRTILQRSLMDSKSWVRLVAAQELLKLQTPPEELLPTLSQLLQSKLASVRSSSLVTISEMGPVARTLQPKVKELTNDENESVRRAAIHAIEALDGVNASEKRSNEHGAAATGRGTSDRISHASHHVTTAYPYDLWIGSSLNRVEQEAEGGRLRIELRRWSDDPKGEREAEFRVTNPGDRPILVWNVRLQVALQHSGEVTQAWETRQSDYPGRGWEHPMIPASESVKFPMASPGEGTWRVCLLYSREMIGSQATNRQFDGTYESIGPIVQDDE